MQTLLLIFYTYIIHIFLHNNVCIDKAVAVSACYNKNICNFKGMLYAITRFKAVAPVLTWSILFTKSVCICCITNSPMPSGQTNNYLFV